MNGKFPKLEFPKFGNFRDWNPGGFGNSGARGESFCAAKNKNLLDPHRFRDTGKFGRLGSFGKLGQTLHVAGVGNAARANTWAADELGNSGIRRFREYRGIREIREIGRFG